MLPNGIKLDTTQRMANEINNCPKRVDKKTHQLIIMNVVLSTGNDSWIIGSRHFAIIKKKSS
jgi:hypothetical protein